MLPEQAPITAAQRKALEELLAGFSPEQRQWLGGVLLGGAASGPKAPELPKVMVLYGTESGNSERLADIVGKTVRKAGYKVSVKNMSETTPADLRGVKNLLVVVSTWGEGDPPESAVPFYKQLMTEKLDLVGLRFSVCALGDTSYTSFCQTGKDVDRRLEELGGERFFPRQDCDVDYDTPFQEWLGGAMKALGPTSVVGGSAAVVSEHAAAGASVYGRKNPFPAELLERVLLNGKGTAKETWHYEFSLAGSGYHYEPGDALAVICVNPPDVVEDILSAAKLSGTETVEVKERGEKPLADALREDFDITALSRPVLTKLHALTASSRLSELLAAESKDRLKDYLWGRWIADAIRDFAVNDLTAADLIGLLRKLPPRLYSIASSPLAHPDEVHLTVASVRYHAHGKSRKGIASTYLADMVAQGDAVPTYLHANKNFRLPESGETPILMIGPGTGVAPFRAFVEHRTALGHTGKSWLFFGDQRFTYDFLYQIEWQDHLKNGALTRLDAAFSRDQPEKIYVQHLLLQRAKEVHAWLEEGACIYVCGDASRMAHDVHETLVTILETQGGKSREAAEEHLAELKKSGRYRRDVY